MYKANTQTEYRQGLRQKILETAMEQFLTKGIKAVKMDDIASALSVSKRTVYEIYENKEQLLMESVRERAFIFDRKMLDFVRDKDRNVIDIILEFYRLKMKSLSNVSPLYFEELHKYPEITAWLDNKRCENDEYSQQFFQEGVDQGFFRADVNYGLITKVSVGTINYVMEKRMYNEFDLSEITRNVIMLFIRGLCTPKGIKELDRKLEATV